MSFVGGGNQSTHYTKKELTEWLEKQGVDSSAMTYQQMRYKRSMITAQAQHEAMKRNGDYLAGVKL